MSSTLKSIRTQLLAVADLIEGGRIADVAFVAIGTDGVPLQGFSITQPATPDALIAGLNETATWARCIEQNEAIAAARKEQADV